MNNLPTVDIKGKEYVLVSDRVLYFNKAYPKGSITTELLSEPQDERIVIKATVIPEEGRSYTGHAQEVVGEGFINKTSAMENAETSAVGRALAMMGIGVVDSIASVDEINKAQTSPQQTKPTNYNSAKPAIDPSKLPNHIPPKPKQPHPYSEIPF